jgi:hypothetical protein
MFFWIYDIPTPAFVALSALAAVSIACLGVIFVGPLLRKVMGAHKEEREQKGWNDIVGYVVSCHCVFYGLLLGLLAVAAYQNLADVEKVVVQEAGGMRAMYKLADAYPEPHRTDLRKHLKDYTRFLIEEAWPGHRRGEIPGGGVKIMGAFEDSLYSFEPKSKGQEIFHCELVRMNNATTEIRRVRMHHVGTGIPPVMWYVVALGAIITMVLVWMFEVRRMRHMILSGLLALFMTAMICLVAAMDHPFRGDVCVDSSAFQQVYERMK